MKFANLRILDHPLIRQKLRYLRDKRTDSLNFRAALSEITGLMAYEVTRNIPIQKIKLETPLEETDGYILARPVTIIPILRAGIPMCEGMLNLIPRARVGHIGLFRDEKTFEPVEYYRKFPSDIADTEIIIVDPMVATGGTASAALDYVKAGGGRFITLVCLVAAPEGIRVLAERHPEVPIYAAALDRELNERAYILPGLGDAGDRMYGTE